MNASDDRMIISESLFKKFLHALWPPMEGIDFKARWRLENADAKRCWKARFLDNIFVNFSSCWRHFAGSEKDDAPACHESFLRTSVPVGKSSMTYPFPSVMLRTSSASEYFFSVRSISR